MKHVLLFLFPALILFQTLPAQNIGGTVKDARTGNPVAFATVQWGGKQGLITNEEGYFLLPSLTGQATILKIACLGYKTRSIPLSTLEEGDHNQVPLEEALMLLDEVFVSNRTPNADEIMAEVRARIPENYVLGSQEHRLFYRETEYVDFENLDLAVSGASSASEADLVQTNRQLDSLSKVVRSQPALHFKDYLGDLYQSDTDSARLLVHKATTLTDTKRTYSIASVQEKAQQIVLQYLDTTRTYKLMTGILKLEDSLALNEGFREEKTAQLSLKQLKKSTLQLINTASLGEDSFLLSLLNPRLYKYRFHKATFLNEELVYAIDVSPRTARAKYAGRVFVKDADYALLKIDYAYAEGKRGEKFNLKFLLGIKYIQNVREGTILFRKREDGKYNPSYVHRADGSYFYVNRPLKFIENSSGKEKTSFNFKISGNSRNKEELLVTHSAEPRVAASPELTEVKDVPLIRLSSYDESIWKNENALQPLQEMKSYKEKD